MLLDTLIKPGSKSLITANSSTQSRAGLVGAHYLPVLKEVLMKAKGPFQSGVMGLGSIPRSKDTGCNGPFITAS